MLNKTHQNTTTHTHPFIRAAQIPTVETVTIYLRYAVNHHTNSHSSIILATTSQQFSCVCGDEPNFVLLSYIYLLLCGVKYFLKIN